MQEFHLGPQPNKEPSKADINIIEKLLGPEAAAKYKGTGEGSESRKDVGYTPSVEDLSGLETLKKEQAIQERKEQEKNIAESKRQMSEWAKASEVDEKYIAKHVTYEPNGDIIWEGECNFSFKETVTTFPPNLKEVRGVLDIRNTKIESLKGCPSSVTELYCSGTNIDSLKGCPSSVIELHCNDTNIESIADCPSSVIELVCSRTNIKSLKGCPLSVTKIYCFGCEKLTEIPVGLYTDLVIYLSKSKKELAADAETKGYKVKYF